MSSNMVNHLEALLLDLEARRVLHAILHATFRDSEVWRCPEDANQTFHQRRAIELRVVLGIERDNSNRALTAAAHALSGTGLFAQIGYMSDRHRWFGWEFSEGIRSDLLDSRSYGYLDVAHVRVCRTALDYWLLEHIALVRAMRTPFMKVPVEWISKLGRGETTHWHRLRPGLVRACRKQSDMWNARLALICYEEGWSDGVDMVELRIAHGGTCWHPDPACKTGPRAVKVVLIDAQGTRDLEPHRATEALRTHLCG
jgi:hypothetical protein